MRLGWRIWLLIIVLVLSVLAMGISFKTGVKVVSLEKNSTLSNAGLQVGEIITAINGKDIENKEQYAQVIESLDLEGLKRIDIKTEKNDYTALINGTIPITVDNVPRSNIKTGLDLRGGARALVQPDQKLDDKQLSDLIEVSRSRFNVYGLSDIQIKGVNDLSGNRFMLVEVAGATPSDLENLIAQQGKFEAKVGNSTVFVGGQNDIADVCRNDASCAGVTECLPDQQGGFVCQFRFTLFLTPQAAQKHADVTNAVGIDSSGKYLSEKLYLFVDGQEVDSLLISTDLKGKVATQISIQGSGVGANQDQAVKNAKDNMKKLQTILITGSLPYKLTIVKLDSISPTLGNQFIKTILLAGLAALIAVSIIVFARYRRWKASIALLFTSFSELIIILGVAALIGWNLDLPSIAGILATIGTGVDSQIVILDESRKGVNASAKERIKRALFVIISAYATSLASLLPLYWAGAGLFKGFALTTIIGITAGVFISRPAFAEMIKRMEE